MPIGRFRETLFKNEAYSKYVSLLISSYNPGAAEKVMCRNLFSVGWDGSLFDCDFNQMLGMKSDEKKFWDIDFNNYNHPILVDDHCYSCTAGAGSSCYGALERSVVKDE